MGALLLVFCTVGYGSSISRDGRVMVFVTKGIRKGLWGVGLGYDSDVCEWMDCKERLLLCQKR